MVGRMLCECLYWLRVVCDARSHAEKAIDIITSILPDDHLLLASSKRVKGQLHTELTKWTAVSSHNTSTMYVWYVWSPLHYIT